MTPPRLREAHAHIAMHGRALSLLRLDDCASRAQMLDRLARAAASLAPGEWLLACGVRTESFTDEPRDGSRWPTRAEL
ncbi:MAG: amidohydrolase, partial [Phycisphaerales bacterium]|nr:amidohydrolase [Phycisphaerales bacterium]